MRSFDSGLSAATLLAIDAEIFVHLIATVTIVDISHLDVPLLHFASRGDFKNVRDRFQKGANVNVQDSLGATPLIYAAGRGDLNLLRELLKHNQVNLNARKQYGPFYIALAMAVCKRGNTQVVPELGTPASQP